MAIDATCTAAITASIAALTTGFVALVRAEKANKVAKQASDAQDPPQK